MTYIQIKPINIKTSGGHSGIITGINPTDNDCLYGQVFMKNSPLDVRWNGAGLCRDNSSELNIDVKNEEIREALAINNHISRN